MTFEEARAQFPVLERYAYLNAGTNGPLARTSIEAMAAEQQRMLEHGRGALPYLLGMLEAREELRRRLAAVLGVDPELVALVGSTTEACNIVLAGLDLAPEDEVVTTDVEHFGLLGPVGASGARVRVAAVRDRRPDEAFDAILAEVGPRTRLVAISHVAWTTGNCLPILELKQSLDAPLLVDGAQSAGAIPVDARPFDFYTVSCQKWLCGPEATGALYVADPEALRVAAPTYASQSTYEPDGSFVPRDGAARFDSGWIPTPALAALAAALDAHPKWRYEGAAAAARRCRELLAAHADVVTAPDQATLVSFRAERDAAELSARLHETGVVVRDLPNTGLVRVSCGYWTSDDDLERLVEALA